MLEGAESTHGGRAGVGRLHEPKPGHATGVLKLKEARQEEKAGAGAENTLEV